MKAKSGPVLKLRAQHSCFVSEQYDMVVTVYSKSKKSLKFSEINWAIECAKADLLEKSRTS